MGTGDVAAWYAARDAGQIVNYGVSVGHIPARMKVLGDPGTGLLPAGIGGSGTASDAQMAAMEAILREGLAQGAVAMGFGSAYTPGAPMSEIERMFKVAAEGGVSAHIHMRGGLQGLHETIAAAAATGAALHIVHVNSSADSAIEAFLAAIKAARDAGQDVTTGSVSLRRGHDGDSVGAVRRLAVVAGCAIRTAPARVDGRAPDARLVRARRAPLAERSSSTGDPRSRRAPPSRARWR